MSEIEVVYNGWYKVYCCFYMKTPKSKPCPAKRTSEAEMKKHCKDSGHPYTGGWYLNPS